MNKLLYLSTALPKEEVDRLRQKQYDFSSNAMLPISVFHGNILAGLQKQYDEITALSGVPIDRKHHKILRYSAHKFQKGNLTFKVPGFFNLPGIKQLTTIFKIYWHTLCWLQKNKKHHCNIIIDGTFYTGLIPLWLAKKTAKAKTAAIIVDYYPFMDPNVNGRSQRLYYKLLTAIDRFIFVTDHLEQLVNRGHKPFMIMEGLVSKELPQGSAETVEDCCLYAGGLQEIYGIKNLVDAFLETDLPYSMHFYGNGDMIDYITEAGKKDPRIQYKGIVTHDELLILERKAKLLINPRPVRGELDTRFNFPSKLMEFMQSGRPAITTRLLGIPQEYDGYMFFFEEDTKDALREGIERVLAHPEEDLATFGRNAADFVNKNKNSDVTAKRIFDLINKEDNYEKTT